MKIGNCFRRRRVMHKGTGERISCENNRGINLFSVVGKIYSGILVDRVRRMTGGLIEDE